VTLGELQKELERYNVRISRGGTFAGNANPWKLLTNVIVAPDNARHFKFERQMERRWAPGDVISLAEDVEVSAASKNA